LVTAGVLWFLKSLSAYDAYPEWLEPVTIYWFVPLEAIGQGEAVDLWRFAWLLTIAIVLYILAIIRFRTQDITV
jgi:putative exporter of polyketide antibiotics